MIYSYDNDQFGVNDWHNKGSDEVEGLVLSKQVEFDSTYQTYMHLQLNKT